MGCCNNHDSGSCHRSGGSSAAQEQDAGVTRGLYRISGLLLLGLLAVAVWAYSGV